jgi:hypothetical protein
VSVSTIIQDLRWLGDARRQYCHLDHSDGGPTPSQYWEASEVERALHQEHQSAARLADILAGGEAWGYLPSWKEPEWDRIVAEREARHADAEALRAEIEHWVADYVRLYPVPYGLPPNLTLATRALALLHAEGL